MHFKPSKRWCNKSKNSGRLLLDWASAITTLRCRMRIQTNKGTVSSVIQLHSRSRLLFQKMVEVMQHPKQGETNVRPVRVLNRNYVVQNLESFFNRVPVRCHFISDWRNSLIDILISGIIQWPGVISHTHKHEPMFAFRRIESERDSERMSF